MDGKLAVYIESFNKWENVSALLRTCWKIRRAFFQPKVLCDIITFHLEKDKRLPKWCTMAIQLDSRLGLPEALVKLDLAEALSNRMALLGVDPRDATGEGCFVTGGFASQVYFGKVWPDSDIDVWRKPQPGENRTKRVKIDMIDNVYDSRGHSVISTFDLSVCQLGVEIKGDAAEPMVWITPLLLYTVFSRNIVCRVLDIEDFYDVDGLLIGADDSEDYVLSLTLDRLSDNHFCNHDQSVALDMCDKCYARCSHSVTKTGDVQKWILRLRKYRQRFPGYTVIYIKDTNA